MIHPKLTTALEYMLLKYQQQLKFYYHYLNYIDFVEDNKMPMPTMGVGIRGYKLTCFYDRGFVESTDLEILTSVLLHECLHLIHNHISRTKGREPRLSNIAQDMILNHIISEIHKMPLGGGWVKLDPNYKGELVYEPLYEWLQEENEKRKNGQPNGLSKETADILDKFQNGMTVDGHFEMSEIEAELAEQIGKEVLEKTKMRMRGEMPNQVNSALELALKRPKTNNLSLVKKLIAATKGTQKYRSYRKLNRRVVGIKGVIKKSLALNVIWDTSGSMWGEHEFVLSEIFRDGYEINLIQIDTAVNKVDRITNKNDLKKMVLASAGGTCLSPAIDYILKPENKLSKYPTIILTDGYTDTLDFQGSMNQFLILTVAENCPIKNAPNVKQIKIEK